MDWLQNLLEKNGVKKKDLGNLVRKAFAYDVDTLPDGREKNIKTATIKTLTDQFKKIDQDKIPEFLQKLLRYKDELTSFWIEADDTHLPIVDYLKKLSREAPAIAYKYKDELLKSGFETEQVHISLGAVTSLVGNTVMKEREKHIPVADHNVLPPRTFLDEEHFRSLAETRTSKKKGS